MLTIAMPPLPPLFVPAADGVATSAMAAVARWLVAVATVAAERPAEAAVAALQSNIGPSTAQRLPPRAQCACGNSRHLLRAPTRWSKASAPTARCRWVSLLRHPPLAPLRLAVGPQVNAQGRLVVGPRATTPPPPRRHRLVVGPRAMRASQASSLTNAWSPYVQLHLLRPHLRQVGPPEVRCLRPRSLGLSSARDLIWRLPATPRPFLSGAGPPFAPPPRALNQSAAGSVLQHCRRRVGLALTAATHGGNGSQRR